MTDRDKFIQKKKEEIEKISKEQLKLSKEFKTIAKRPVAKRLETQIERCFKLTRLAILIKQLEIQKHLVIAQPFPKFPKGAPSARPAIVGDSGKEEIILTPSHLQP